MKVIFFKKIACFVFQVIKLLSLATLCQAVGHFLVLIHLFRWDYCIRDYLHSFLPNLSYDEVLVHSGLQTLLECWGQACECFVQAIISIILSLHCTSATWMIKRQPWIRSPLWWSWASASVTTDLCALINRFITFKYMYM